MVAKRWTTSDVNGHLDDMLDRVKDDGPQEMTRNDELFVVVTAEDWRRRRSDNAVRPDEEPEALLDRQQQLTVEGRSDWNDREFRNPFAWVEEMSEVEVDAWEQRMDEARTRRTQASDAGDQ